MKKWLNAVPPSERGTPGLMIGAGGLALDPSFDMMIVPGAANMPPTPWQTEILALGIWAGAVPRICRTLSYMPYMPACMYERPPPLVLSGNLPPGRVALGNEGDRPHRAAQARDLRGRRSAGAQSLPLAANTGRRRSSDGRCRHARCRPRGGEAWQCGGCACRPHPWRNRRPYRGAEGELR